MGLRLCYASGFAQLAGLVVLTTQRLLMTGCRYFRDCGLKTVDRKPSALNPKARRSQVPSTKTLRATSVGPSIRLPPLLRSRVHALGFGVVVVIMALC